MELHEIKKDIEALSGELDDLGNALIAMADRVKELYPELFKHRVNQADDIRSKESGGMLTLKNGTKVKLTDKVREDLTHYGKLEEFSEYETTKRVRDILKIAVEAKKSALNGKQSLSSIIKKEMEL